MPPAGPGDSEGDTDLDLHAFAALQRCFNEDGRADEAGCEYVDLNGDGLVSLEDAASFTAAMTGPTATLPADYVLADAVIG